MSCFVAGRLGACRDLAFLCNGWKSPRGFPARRAAHSESGASAWHSRHVWLVYEDSKVATLAGALCRHVRGASRGSMLPTLEAMGPVPISRAVNAVALCNRMLDASSGPGLEAEHIGRLAFAPAVRVFVQREREDVTRLVQGPEHLGHSVPSQHPSNVVAPRRTMQLHLRLAFRGSREPRPDEDIIRVSGRTDLVRLSGLISTRWAVVEAQVAESDVLVQALGPTSINIMVRAFAMSWEKAARSYDGGFHEAAFACLASHMPLVDGKANQAGRYSGVQCMLVPSANA